MGFPAIRKSMIQLAVDAKEQGRHLLTQMYQESAIRIGNEVLEQYIKDNPCPPPSHRS